MKRSGKSRRALLNVMLYCTLGAMLLPSLTACSRSGGGGQSTSAADAATDPVTEPPHTVTLPSGANALVSGDFSLEFRAVDGGFGVYVTDTADSVVMFANDAPASVTVRARRDPVEGGGAAEAAYKTVGVVGDTLVAEAVVTSANGSVFGFTDTYSVTGDGRFAVARKVDVRETGKEDVGFRTLYSLRDPDVTSTVGDHSILIPSILYKDSSDTVGNAIGADPNAKRVYVKETRTGLPLVMMRSDTTGSSVAVAHLHPDIDVGGALGGGANGEVSDKLMYGSVGYTVNGGLSVDFCYPSLETPTVYYTALTSRCIYHPVRVGFSHSYDLSIIPARKPSYAEAMAYTYREAFTAESPRIAEEIDIDAVYDDTLKLFTETYREFGTGSVVAAGVPWSIDLKTGNVVEYTFQMGFVGQQTSVGYHLMKYGCEKNDETMIDQGRKIIDFWTSDTIMHGSVPIVWWDPVNDAAAGHSRGYPSFLRCFTDGMEGVLDAYRLAVQNGESRPGWLAALKKTADFLVRAQNGDGSFYRAYNTDGSVCTNTSDRNTQGTSKVNTPVAIRFLARMYELTGDEKYKTAALRAAEFSYDELYLGREKYVGGTPDNANTVDKEAAIYAFYGFNAAYALTGDGKYLAAAEHAAASAMSWVYCYDFGCPSSEENSAINPFAHGRTSGFSVIATGHSGADNYSAAMYYEIFRLYVYTGDEFYLEAAKFLELNTKLSTDYDGTMGWKYRALGPEATNVSDFDFGTVGVWLPWSGVVNIGPIDCMRDTFGSADIGSLDLSLDELRAKLDACGAGGRLTGE